MRNHWTLILNLILTLILENPKSGKAIWKSSITEPFSAEKHEKKFANMISYRLTNSHLRDSSRPVDQNRICKKFSRNVESYPNIVTLLLHSITDSYVRQRRVTTRGRLATAMSTKSLGDKAKCDHQVKIFCSLMRAYRVILRQLDSSDPTVAWVSYKTHCLSSRQGSMFPAWLQRLCLHFEIYILPKIYLSSLNLN